MSYRSNEQILSISHPLPNATSTPLNLNRGKNFSKFRQFNSQEMTKHQFDEDSSILNHTHQNQPLLSNNALSNSQLNIEKFKNPTTNLLNLSICTSSSPSQLIEIPDIDIPKEISLIPDSTMNISILENDDNLLKLFEDNLSTVKGNSSAKAKFDMKKNLHMLDPCKCRLNCSALIPTNQRQRIFNYYIACSYGNKRRFFDAFIEQIIKKTHKTDAQSNRKYTRTYFLPLENGDKQRVCQKMFLATLGIKSENIISYYLKQKTLNGGLPILSDKRGSYKKTKIFKIKDNIKTQINSFHPQVSHYTQTHAPYRRYLDAPFSLMICYKDYISRNDKISYRHYCRIFKQFNIGFGLPKPDLCDICANEKIHKLTHKNLAIDNDCEMCNLHSVHIKQANSMRIDYIRDRNTYEEQSIVYTADLQKVLLLPILPTKECFFKSRLVCFNETFGSLSTKSDICVIWHEAISGRKASSIISSFYCLIQNTCIGINNVTFWCDNCTAQNKNWKFFYAMCLIVNHHLTIKTITVKYLEKGHTYMRSDCIHGAIGKKIKKTPDICDFDDLNNLIISSMSNLITLLLCENNFLVWPEYPNSIGTGPKIRNIRVAEFHSGSGLLFWKSDISATEFNTYQLSANINENNIPLDYFPARGINQSKKEEIIKSLCPLMPESKRKFWSNLQGTLVPDLASDFS